VVELASAELRRGTRVPSPLRYTPRADALSPAQQAFPRNGAAITIELSYPQISIGTPMVWDSEVK
jgi:hypothetical protein